MLAGGLEPAPDWAWVRAQFPVVQERIYLDNASMSPLASPVHEAYSAWLEGRRRVGHGFPAWFEQAERVRERLARFLGVAAGEIAFAGSTSAAINLIAQSIDWRPGDNVVTNALEFPANVYPWLNLRRRGVEVRLVQPGEGRVDWEDVAPYVDRRTRLVAVSHVQALTGYRCDLERFSQACRERGILLAVDLAQSVGCLRVDLRRTPVDFAFAPTFKWLLGPDGLAFLYCREDLAERMEPAFLGWLSVRRWPSYLEFDSQLAAGARRFEQGNPNFSALAALDAALDFLARIGVVHVEARVLSLVGRLSRRLSELGNRVAVYAFPHGHRSGILTFDVPHRERLYDRLRGQGFVVALRPFGIRVSPHCFNTEGELDRLVDAVRAHLEGE